MFAEILRGLQQNAQQETSQQTQPSDGQQGSVGQSGGTPAGANPNDSSGVGGGQIGTGSVPSAGEDNFTGNPQGPQG